MAKNQALASATENKTPLQVVGASIQKLAASGRLPMFPDYSPEVALQQAWQDIKQDSNLSKCETESIQNALFDMVIQGLNPVKFQCYFIPRNNKLCMDRSYFGDVHVAQTVRPGLVVFSDVIYEGEEVILDTVISEHGLITIVAKHLKPWPRKSSEITGAYAGGIINKPDGTIAHVGVEIMSIEQIKKSWLRGHLYKGENGNSFHNTHPDQACIRTVTRRFCKPIINMSNDEVLLASVKRQEFDSIEAEANDVVEQNAGKSEVLSMGTGEVIKEAPAVKPDTVVAPIVAETVDDGEQPAIVEAATPDPY